MGFRLIILAAMGLGALYMMHLLAQDYDRIRRPLTKIIERALRGKRDIATFESNEISGISVDWKRIMDHDPLSCLQSLICQIMSGAQANDSEAIALRHFIKLTHRDAPLQVSSAYAKGIIFNGATKNCYVEYPYCWYSAETMLRFLRWFA